MAEKEIMDITRRSLAAMESALNKKAESVISVTREGAEWKAVVEVLERRAVPDTQDLLGRYEVRFTREGSMLGYKQVLLRQRVPPYGAGAEEV
ncbi:MAG: gas vesicle protein GvpO [Hadesarchaea archaeon]|nr:gas vesicle protein GvpO [Hadesarchaea archaeon]